MRSAQPSLPSRQVERFVTVRMTRQQVLSRPDPPAYNSIIGEATLRQQVGGRQAMKDQLTKVLEVAELKHVTVRVLPFSAGAHAGLTGPFEIMRIGDPATFSVAIFDNPTGRLFIDQDDEVERYGARLDSVADATLSPEDWRTLITRLMSEM